MPKAELQSKASKMEQANLTPREERKPVPIEGRGLEEIDIDIWLPGSFTKPIDSCLFKRYKNMCKGTISLRKIMQSALPEIFAGGDIVEAEQRLFWPWATAGAASAMHDYLSKK